MFSGIEVFCEDVRELQAREPVGVEWSLEVGDAGRSDAFLEPSGALLIETVWLGADQEHDLHGRDRIAACRRRRVTEPRRNVTQAEIQSFSPPASTTRR
jgi:hypothetical protein